MGDTSDNRVAESVQRSTDLGTSTVTVSVDDIDAAGLQHVSRFVKKSCESHHHAIVPGGRSCECGFFKVTAASPVNHPGTLQPVSQPATSPPLSDDDTVVVDVCALPAHHAEIVRLDAKVTELTRLYEATKKENTRLREQLSTVCRRAIDDIQATPLRTWIRSFFGASV